jgi:hypothetical protein
MSSNPDITLSFVSFHPETGARFRMKNASGRTITWTGYGGSPLYRLRQRDLFGWHERDVGWFCGVGLGTRRLQPGQSTEFSVDLPVRDLRPIQVGNDYDVPPGQQDLTVWSAPLSPTQCRRTNVEQIPAKP